MRNIMQVKTSEFVINDRYLNTTTKSYDKKTFFT